MPPQVFVTTHALRRWQERCARRADEDVHDVLAAFAETVKGALPPGMMFLPQGHSVWVHREIGCYFVVRSGETHDRGTLVTVLTEDVNRNFVRPKLKPVETPRQLYRRLVREVSEMSRTDEGYEEKHAAMMEAKKFDDVKKQTAAS